MSGRVARVKRTNCAVLAAVLLSGLCCSHAQAEWPDTDDAAFMGKMSIQVDKDIDQKHCLVRVTGDYSKFLEILPGLVESGVIGRGKPVDEVRKTPFTAAGVWLLEVSVFSLITAYKKVPTLNHCRFEDYLVVSDDFGNDKKHLAYSFGFDRATYEKAHWEKMSPLNAAKIAQGFTTSDWFDEQVSGE